MNYYEHRLRELELNIKLVENKNKMLYDSFISERDAVLKRLNEPTSRITV